MPMKDIYLFTKDMVTLWDVGPSQTNETLLSRMTGKLSGTLKKYHVKNKV